MNPLLAAAAGLLLWLQVPGLQIPRPTGYVNDFANVLSPEAERELSAMAQGVRTASGGEIAVVTLTDLGGRDVSDVALEIGRQWGVGAKGAIGDSTRNAGAVVLIVPKETASDNRGRCWVATGRGTEGFILDSDAGSICREATPLFQRRDYSGGVELVTYRVAQEFAQEFGFDLNQAVQAPAVATQPQRRPRSRGFPLAPVLFVVLIVIVSSLGRRGRRGGGGGGGLGGALPWIILSQTGFPETLFTEDFTNAGLGLADTGVLATPVPEPATLAIGLVCGGLAVLNRRLRRRRSACPTSRRSVHWKG